MLYIKLFCAETGILWYNYTINMAADALAPCVTWSQSASFNLQVRELFLIHEETFQLPAAAIAIAEKLLKIQI